MKRLYKEDIIDLLYGCTVLGTGGGGSLAQGLEIMQEDFEQNRVLTVVSLSEIPDDAMVASPYGCGAPSAAATEQDRFKKLPHVKGSPAVLAFQALEEFLQTKIFAISSTELGGMNTAEALHIACLLELPLADGDPAGRSVPELIHSTFYLKGKSITPLAVASKFGDVAILKDAVSDFRAEDLVRAMACASGDEISVCNHPMTGLEYRQSIIPGAISHAWEIGRILRRARRENIDAASAIADAMGGAMLFRGIVTALPWECRDGFDYGEIHLKGIKEYDGEAYKIIFKNENLASYRNDRIDVTVPDLICMIDKDGDPMTTPDFRVGDEMNVFALPAPQLWTTAEGLSIFGPRYFGIDADYIPFKQNRRNDR